MIKIDREALNSKDLNRIGARLPETQRTFSDIKNKLQSKRWRWRKILNKYLPITDWLVNYNVRGDLLADIVAGITIAIMNIPQGMAYALLANVPPIYGIYTSIFPVIVYCIFGPSKHISMGTNPLTSILTANVISLMIGGGDTTTNTDGKSTDWSTFFNPPRRSMRANPDDYTDIQIAVALSLLVGVWQVLFSLVKFGKLSWILSDVLVSGYTTGAAFHVLTSQLKGIFGLDLVEPDGYFVKMFLIWIDVFKQIASTNWASFTIAGICIIVLVINDEVLKPRVAKKCSFPIPIQLIVVIFGTLFSYLFEFSDKYEVDIVGNISTAGPQVEPPTMDKNLFSTLVVNSIIIAVVGYCVTLSMAKIYANKFSYKIDGNQELFSEGLSNLVGCFFQCIPSGASMSRTSVQVAVGGKTQLTSIVSIGILFVVIYKAGPLFEFLPKAVLSAIIVVALKGMFWQVYDLPKFASRSKLDAGLWIGCFLAVIIMDIDTGLVIGIALSLLILLYRSIAVSVDELGSIENTGVYGRRKDYNGADRRADTIILKIGGPITFANFEGILEKLRKKLKHIHRTSTVMHLILEMSAVSYIDQSAGKAFKEWMKKDAKVYKKSLACCNAVVESMLLKLELSSSCMYPTVDDACFFEESRNMQESEFDGKENNQPPPVKISMSNASYKTIDTPFEAGIYRQISIT